MPVAGLSFMPVPLAAALCSQPPVLPALYLSGRGSDFCLYGYFDTFCCRLGLCRFLTAYGSSDDWAAAGVLFLGIFPFPALLTVPVNFIFSSRHPAPAKACCLGLFSSAAMICVIPFQMIFAYFPGPAIVLLFSMMTVCSVRLPVPGDRSHADMMCRRSRRSVYCCFRIRAFTFLSSFCAAGPLSRHMDGKNSGSAANTPLIAGAAAGPVLTAAVIAKRGYMQEAYSLYFSLSFLLWDGICRKRPFYFSSVMAGAAFSSVFLACPAAAYYYLGLSSSLDDGTSSAACIMAGAAISHIFSGHTFPSYGAPSCHCALPLCR